MNKQAALNFIASGQANPHHRMAGAFRCDLEGGATKPQADWTLFHTAMLVSLLEVAEPESNLIPPAKAFLRNVGHQHPSGGYAFWPEQASYHSKPDLDDTALVHLALRSWETVDRFNDLALALLALYRCVAGTRLAPVSLWASAFPSVFYTWMDVDDPAVVDVVVVAHVCRLLLSAGLTDFPGLRASLRMLAQLVRDAQSYPSIERLSPYYRSQARFWYACAILPPTTPEAIEVRAVVSGCLSQFDWQKICTPDSCLWLANASQACGLAINAAVMNTITQAQQVDGGWPAIGICNDLSNNWYWTSRIVPTVLALSLASQNLFHLPVMTEETAPIC